MVSWAGLCADPPAPRTRITGHFISWTEAIGAQEWYLRLPLLGKEGQSGFEG